MDDGGSNWGRDGGSNCCACIGNGGSKDCFIMKQSSPIANTYVQALFIVVVDPSLGLSTIKVGKG